MTELQNRILDDIQNNRVQDIDGYAYQFVNQQDITSTIFCYATYATKKTLTANNYFNYAYYLNKNSQYLEAINAYEQALSLGITGPEDVYLNLSRIYSENLSNETKAIDCLSIALSINEQHIPSIFNLAVLKEEQGNKKPALALFDQILEIEPNNIEVHVRRLMLLGKHDSELIGKSLEVLTKFVTSQRADVGTLGVLSDSHFALGKCHDQQQEYSEAWNHYVKANSYQSAMQRQYDAEKIEQLVNRNITIFDEKWFSDLTNGSESQPIFICGSFRSGSTLLEQVLSSHSQLSSGGELPIIPQLITANYPNFPLDFCQEPECRYSELSSFYMAELEKRFGNQVTVIDKRMESVELIGALKSLFPNAKIIITERDFHSNLLSIYFQKLDSKISYACDIENIRHYLTEIKRLTDHWITLFGSSILRVRYEDLVSDFQGTTDMALKFLNLQPEKNLREFYQQQNYVKTASVWQVRQPLYTDSLDRYENYKGLTKKVG